MSEPSEWAKRKAAELYHDHFRVPEERIAAALEEAAQRERYACFSLAAIPGHTVAMGIAGAIGDRGPMLAPDSQRGAA